MCVCVCVCVCALCVCVCVCVLLFVYRCVHTCINILYAYALAYKCPHASISAHTHVVCLQVIDMRWGLREDTNVEHTTVDVCLEEIDRSQRISAGPYFVVGSLYTLAMLATTKTAITCSENVIHSSLSGLLFLKTLTQPFG